MEWNEFAVAQTIREWLEAQKKESGRVPDFWDELDTTDRLAKWLHDSGLRYSR